MTEPLLHDKVLDVDRQRVGISYSGGGPLLLVELGIAQAFVELGITPYAIAGVSAGAIAAVAHAIDPKNGEGIRMAAEQLTNVSDRKLKLTLPQIVFSAIWHRQRLAALGDNEPIKGLLKRAFQSLAGKDQLDVGYFAQPDRPTLILGAADRLKGEPQWFKAGQGTADVADALVASSAIPAVFPTKSMDVGGLRRLFVDGGVACNQPLSVLALEGCGTIYACAVGYDGEQLKEPANLIDNLTQSISITMHQASRLEQSYVECRMAGQGVIHHIHPDVKFPVHGFNFDSNSIATVMNDARVATKDWITKKQLMPSMSQPNGSDLLA
jgi:predicted acylesterase/phospholipase RssA